MARMIKFSVIIPIYNVENYLHKCLDSLINQTFGYFECILVCDDSTDNSTAIAYEYAKKDKRFKITCQSNTGLSLARNIGVDSAKGDYLLFLDSDDYYDLNLLKKLHEEIKNEDLIRFQVREVFNDYSKEWKETPFAGTGVEVFSEIINFHYIEPAWAYCYKKSFYDDNNFKFKERCIAEDYGLIPLIIARASKVKIISFIGYNYVQRENSMMSTNDYSKKIQKMNDMIKQAKWLYREFSNINNKELFMMFINNSLIYYSTTLKYCDYKKYKKKLRNMNVYDSIPSDSYKRKIKKFLIKLNAYLFYNYIARFL